MDEVDHQLNRDAPWDEAMIKKARDLAAKIPKGVHGVCWSCDEWSQRLVQGACATCRDRYKLP